MRPAANPLPSVVRQVAAGRSAVRWRVFTMLCVASFVAFVLRTNMSIAQERMTTDLGLTKVQLGWVMAAFAWGYALFQLPGGIWGDRLGARGSLTVIVTAWGVLNLLIGLAPGPEHAPPWVVLGVLMLLRALMGAAQAPLCPVGSGALTLWFPATSWGNANRLLSVAMTLGASATGPLIAWLMDATNWRLSFVLTVPLAFLTAAVWWRHARDTPAEHPDVRTDELEIIRSNRGFRAAGRAKGDWRAVVGDRQVQLLTGSYFCSNYVFYFFFNWLFDYLVNHRGLKTLEGGLYAMAPWMAGAVGAFLGGLACDRLTRRVGLGRGCRWPAMAGLVLSGILIVAAGRAGNPLLAVVLLSVCLACAQFTEASYWTATIAVSGPDAFVAGGVLNTGGNLVGGFCALLVPLTVQALGWEIALVTAALFALLGAAMWLGIRADRGPEAGVPGRGNTQRHHRVPL